MGFGLNSFYHALKGKGPDEIENLLLKMKGSQTLVSSYLEENVYNLLTDEKKDFLIKTSILPRVKALFCDQLLNIQNSRDILKDLQKNHMFTSSFDDPDEWYGYHRIFRDFLQAKLVAELGFKAVLELYQQAAGLLERFDEDENAVPDDENDASFSKILRISDTNASKTSGSLKLLKTSDRYKANDIHVDYRKGIPKLPAPSLKVYLFGKFKVFQGDREIPDKRWKSKKAQMIFKYLIYHRKKGYLKKDVLMELLWPEDDPAKTAKRFHVALASMRKTLEPDINRGTPSAYISRSGDAYRIDLGAEGSVDIEEFTKKLKRAQKVQDSDVVLQHYLNAVSLYTGDFLEEDLYVPWCDDEREHFKENFLYILAKIIQHYEIQKDYLTCIDYAGRYLKVDRYAENIYRQLMRCYAITGSKAMVIRTFERCSQNIAQELDIPLSQETEALFKKLMST